MYGRPPISLRPLAAALLIFPDTCRGVSSFKCFISGILSSLVIRVARVPRSAPVTTDKLTLFFIESHHALVIAPASAVVFPAASISSHL
jgi:hypothetical protein